MFSVRADEQAIEYHQDGRMLGEITWVLRDDTMVMDHTYVSNELRGQGVAKKLLDEAAKYAREHNYKMKAVCSYVVTAFDRYDDYKDVQVS
ncbi:MAG: GNAT family N-acetyltransferase [Caryophanon sp.]|nr:GNAT family N-acetyltransferase [Caryophanon sp.]